MTIRINIGCGRTPIDGWINFDNSLAIKLANSPLLYLLAKFLRLLNKQQIENVEWNKKHKINFADATKKIPLEANSVECIYTSHMLEHLSCDGASAFLIEALRILKKGGVLRIAVPDLRIVVNNYSTVGDANKFMEQMFVQAPPIRNLKEKLKLIISGYRHHQWMYDGKSLSLLMEESGFRDVRVYSEGETSIKNLNGLNLHERSEESVYVEGIK
jgi:predicted SAM-dependent methyltransferase